VPRDHVPDLVGLDDGGEDVAQLAIADDRDPHREQQRPVGAPGEIADGRRARPNDAV
jgi:hypothetical protein